MNKLKLVIGNKNYSSWSLRPWFFLKNLGINFDEELVFLFEENTKEKLKPYFSDEKVPILLDGDLQVWDSLAIIETLADKFPDKLGWPEDANAKAIARAVSAEMHSGYFALRDALPMNCRKNFPDHPITNEVQRDIDRIISVWEYCRMNYANDGPWLFGKFSGADAMFAPIVLRLSGYDVKVSGVAKEYIDTVLKNEHIQNWIEAGKIEKQIIKIDEV